MRTSETPPLEEGAALFQQGAIRSGWASHDLEQQRGILTAIGAYQLEEVLNASDRLREGNVAHSVVYLLEPGRFPNPRSHREKAHRAPVHLQAELYPRPVPARIFSDSYPDRGRVRGLSAASHGGRSDLSARIYEPGRDLKRFRNAFCQSIRLGHILQEVVSVLGKVKNDYSLLRNWKL